MKSKPWYRVQRVSGPGDGGRAVLGVNDEPSPLHGGVGAEASRSRRPLIISVLAAAAAIVIAAVTVAALISRFSGGDADTEAADGLGSAIAATDTEPTTGLADQGDAATADGANSIRAGQGDNPDLFVQGNQDAADDDPANDPDGGATTSATAATSTTDAQDSTSPSEATDDVPTGGDLATSTTADATTTVVDSTGTATTPNDQTTDPAETTDPGETTQPPTTLQTTTEAPTTTAADATTTAGSQGGSTCASNGEFERVFRDDFNGSSVGGDWTLYNSPGNSGFGLRRPSAITVSDGKLVITAKMENGSLVSGGMALGLDLQYGKYVFRVRTDNDPSQAVSGVVLTWPQAGNNHLNGENNMYETLTKTQSRNPFYSFIHKPFGNATTQEFYRHDADGAQFQVMSMEWTPDRITITREGPGSRSSDSWTVNETGADLIPDVPHHLAIQLDGWKDSIGGTVRMEVDYVEVYKYCG